MSGVVGIYSKNKVEASNIVYYGLYSLQHRGQVSAGIAVNNNGFLDYYKSTGLVHEVFTEELIARLRGNLALGHVRYATVGSGTDINAQPMVIGYKKGALALAHDGSIVNYRELKEKLESQGGIFQTQVDTEVIASLIARNHKDSIEDAIYQSLEEVKGTYGLIIMTTDKLIGARDPYGVKPLVLGSFKGSYLIASETCAFDTIGGEYIRDILPGEILIIDENGLRSLYLKERKPSLCLFEMIYFARPDSRLDGRSIYLSRIEAGRQLARDYPYKGDIVIGAPDSGTIPALGYSQESGIAYVEGLIKNRYVGRTFIEPSQDLREEGVRIKLNVVDENVRGKKVILVDDSIVRGTTMKRTVKMLRDAGAKEVHVRIASSPVTYTCHLGINTPSRENLLAAYRSKEEIEKDIGADSLEYLSIDALTRSMGGAGFCTGCFNGEYPIENKE